MPQMGRSFATVAVALLLPAVQAQTHFGPDYVPPQEHPLPIWLSQPKQVKIAECVIDVGLSTILLGQAGNSINAAVKTCKRQITDKDKAACSASVSGILFGFGYAAGFLAQAASDCQASLQVVQETAVRQAACAADIASLTAMLALIANSGSSMREVCDVHTPHVTADQSLSVNDRRLQKPFNHTEVAYKWVEKFGNGHSDVSDFASHDTAEEAPDRDLFIGPMASRKRLKDRAGEIAECAFDVGQSVLFVSRAAMMINSAVSDCSRFDLRTGGLPARAKCSVDVSSVIGAFSFMASGISFACFHCPFYKKSQPACAGAIINLIAALAEIAAVGSSLEANCAYDPAHAARRLNASEATVV